MSRKKEILKLGGFWGIGMFLVMEIGSPYYKDEPIMLKNLLIGALVWAAGGWLFGWMMTWGYSKK